MAAVALASAPSPRWSSIRVALLGLCLGLTATTKLALLPGVAAVGMFVVAALVWQARRPALPGAAARRLALLALAFCIVAAPWWARNIVRFGNPIYPAALPLIGRGYVVGDFSKNDARYVPIPAAWPLYPLFEPHSEESGLGALFAVGAIPGAVYGMLRRRKHPIVLYLLVVGVTLPAWWALTPHDPRFLVGIFGLGFAFLPWSLMAVARSYRRYGAAVLAVAAIFSALVTLDQVLLPAAKLPSDRWEFYDRVWTIDPAVASLPESEGILFQQGYAPLSYAGDYPMLGRSHTRPLIVVDAGTSIDLIIARMRQAGIRYVYAAAAPDSRAIVESLYDPAHFVLEHVSVVEDGIARGTQRYLYRLK